MSHTFVEMACGECSGMFSMDTEVEGDDTALWMLVLRFANAHVDCGYMTSGVSPEAEEDDEEPAPKVRKIRRKPVDDEDDE